MTSPEVPKFGDARIIVPRSIERENNEPTVEDVREAGKFYKGEVETVRNTFPDENVVRKDINIVGHNIGLGPGVINRVFTTEDMSRRLGTVDVGVDEAAKRTQGKIDDIIASLPI